MNTLLVPITLCIHAVSFLLMLAIIFEYIHIHNKRIYLLKELGSSEVAWELLQRKLLIFWYLVFTLILIGSTTFLIL